VGQDEVLGVPEGRKDAALKGVGHQGDYRMELELLTNTHLFNGKGVECGKSGESGESGDRAG